MSMSVGAASRDAKRRLSSFQWSAPHRRCPFLSLAQLLASLRSDHAMSMGELHGIVITLGVIENSVYSRTMAVQIPLLKPERLAPLPTDAEHYVAALQNKPGE